MKIYLKLTIKLSLIILCFMIARSLKGFAGQDPTEATNLLYKAWNSPTAEESLRYYNELIERYPGSNAAKRSRKDLVDFYMYSGDMEKALQCQRQYVADYPQDGDAERFQFYLSDQLRALGKYEEAGKEYKKFLEMYPLSSFAEDARWYLLDVEFNRLKQISQKDAIIRYEQFGEKSKYRVDALWGIAMILHERLHDYKEAIAYYQKFYAEFPKSDRAAETLFNISEVYKKMGDDEKALKNYEKIAEDYSGSKWAGNAMMEMVFVGEKFVKKQEYEKASKIYKKFCELFPLQGWYSSKGRGGYLGYGFEREIMQRIGDIAVSQNNFKEAILYYQKILKYKEEFLTIGFGHYGKTIACCVDFRQVYRHFEKIYEQTGDAQKAKEIQAQLQNLEKDIAAIQMAIINYLKADSYNSRIRVDFSSIDIQDRDAVSEVNEFVGGEGRGGCGFKIWLHRDGQTWEVKKVKRTWVS